MRNKKKNRNNLRGRYARYDYEAAFGRVLSTVEREQISEDLIRKRLKKMGRKSVYALKEVRSGEQLEVEIYPQFRQDEIPEEWKIKRDNSLAQKKLNDKNARKYVQRLINHNFDDGDLWITLTYQDEKLPENMEEALKNMQNYIRRINYRRKKKGLPNCKYIYVTEYSPTSKIRWHHHMIMDGEMDMETVEACWKLGKRNEIRRLSKDEHGLTGMAKYITKEPANMQKKERERTKGQKRWCSSQNLEQFRVRVVHSKPNKNGKYKAIEKFLKEMIRDNNSIKNIMQQWYPEYAYTDAEVRWNEYNCMFYVSARMRHCKQKT